MLSAQAANDLGVDLSIAHAATLELLLDLGNPAATASVIGQLQSGESTAIALDIARVRVNSPGNPAEMKAIDTIANGWTYLQELRASGGLSGASKRAVATEVNKVESTYDAMTAAASSIVHVEGKQARTAYEASLASYNSSIDLMIWY